MSERAQSHWQRQGLYDPAFERDACGVGTRVQVSADLRHARVFYSVLATDEVKVAVAAGLDSARGYLKRELGRRLQLRYMPDIVFCYDDSLDYGSRIHRLLTELKKSDLA